MNQEKIGKFIAKKRSDKKLTQEELAKRLGVSDKAISKWENGHCLPDVSLFKDLCKELDITVNELLNGEDSKKSEDGYIKYLEYTKKKSNLRVIILSIVSLVVFVLMVLGIFFLNNYGKTTMYKLYGSNDNFEYQNGALTISGEKIVFSTGRLIVTNNDIATNDILSVELLAKDEFLTSTNLLNGGTLIVEDNGYNEIFTQRKIDNLDSWIIKIQYLKDKKIQEEIIEVKNEELIRTDKFFDKKELPIGVDKNNESDEEETVQGDPEELRKKLIKEGFKQSVKTYYSGRTESNYFYLEKTEDDFTYYIDCYHKSVMVKVSNEIYYSQGWLREYGMVFFLTMRDTDNFVSYDYYFDTREIIGCEKEDSCPSSVWQDSVDIYSRIQELIN